jgi:hypothetical protein
MNQHLTTLNLEDRDRLQMTGHGAVTPRILPGKSVSDALRVHISA